MPRSTALRAATLALVGALSLTACGASSGDDAGADPAEAGTAEFRFPVTATIPTLDPHVSPSGVVAEIDRHVYETLVAYDSESTPQPALAESWESSEDGSAWTFHLREGVTFHNGEPLTADDVVASLNKWKGATARAQTFMGDAEFAAVDASTVELVLAGPRGDVLDQLANPLQFAAIMPASVVEGAAPEGVTEYVGTGPYEFVEWAQDQHVHVTRYEGYVGSAAAPSGMSGRKDAPTKDLYFDFVTDTSTRFSSFLSGQYDVVDVSVDQLPQVESDPAVELSRNIANGFNVVFNMTSPLFADLRAREAVAATIDADEFMLAVVSDPELYRLNPSYAFTENSTWWSDAGSAGVYDQGDPERAADLLAQTDYDGEEVRILTSRDYGGVYYDSAVILQSQLVEAGFNASLVEYDYATLIQHRNSLEGWDIYTGAFLVPSTPSQLLYLTPNYAGNDDPAVADLLTATAAATSPEAKIAASEALETYLWQQLPVINVGDSYEYIAVRDTVEGYEVFDGSSVLWNVRVDG